MQSHSLYLHIPFCTHRCAYCDFNTFSGLEALMPAYVEALVTEIGAFAATAPQRIPLQTIFFGGGTPSLLPPADIARILGAVAAAFDLLPEAEVSLEANPGTLDAEQLTSLRSAGINRLSLGVQSANPEELRLLDRVHDYPQVIQAVNWARQAGFDNLNLDLIYALPGQSLASWQRTLELVLGLHPEHLSLYALSFEHGTPFQSMASRGLFSMPDADLAAEMYEFASAELEAAGYEQYEISNWARRRDGELLACRHNLQYWRNLPYIGLGAGAHGWVGGMRTVATLAPAAYIQRLGNGAAPAFPRTLATMSAELVDGSQEMAETMMMGLRLVQEGVSRAAFKSRFGHPLGDAYSSEIGNLTARGLLESPDGDTLRLTRGGRLLGNQVFMEFV